MSGATKVLVKAMNERFERKKAQKGELKNGYYLFSSERSSNRAIAQHINGEWFTINEVGPITLEELKIRGWDLEERVKGQDYKETD